ncbi:MAG: isochorismatase family protein, partial [Candidatus Tectomicrobia bacterium]|nr:isochorismatase family protein [Candidatus Tectomicrobia bacterium]
MESPVPDIPLNDCALLVIDMQNDFLSDKGYFAERGIDLTPFQRTIPRVKTVVEFARAHGVPVIFTEQRYDPRGLDWPEKLHRVLPANFRNKQGGPR